MLYYLGAGRVNVNVEHQSECCTPFFAQEVASNVYKLINNPLIHYG